MASSKTPITRDQEISFEIKFFEECDPADGSATFKAGKVYELPASSANRWIRRNKAERYVPKPKPKPESKAVKAPPKKRTYTRRTTTAKPKAPVARKTTPAQKSTVVIPEEKKMPDGDTPLEKLTTDL